MDETCTGVRLCCTIHIFRERDRHSTSLSAVYKVVSQIIAGERLRDSERACRLGRGHLEPLAVALMPHHLSGTLRLRRIARGLGDL